MDGEERYTPGYKEGVKDGAADDISYCDVGVFSEGGYEGDRKLMEGSADDEICYADICDIRFNDVAENQISDPLAIGP